MTDPNPSASRVLYDPPVERKALTLERDVPFAERNRYLQEVLRLDGGQVEGLMWHGGIFHERVRLEPGSQTTFKAGSSLEIYRFLREPKFMELPDSCFLFESDDLLAVNKPAWLPVQGTRVSIRFSLEEILKEKTRNKNLMAIHRLDRQTSGVLLFAKHGQAAARIMKHFAAHRVFKRYFAVVSPPVGKRDWVVEGYLARDFKRLPQIYYRLVEKVRPKARFSRTRFRALGVRNGRALVEAVPETGRTHQIRVHLTSQGTPILGDDLYGGKGAEAGRVQLHAYELRFEQIKIKAPLPSDFIW